MDWDALRDYRKLADHAVRRDSWDERDWQKAHSTITPLQAATEELVDMIGTGRNLMADVFSLLFKAVPEIVDRTEMKPEGWVNHTVVTEVPGLSDYTTLRRYTRNSEVDTALACAAIEPDLETLADRAKQRDNEAQVLQNKLDALRAALEEKLTVDDLLDQWFGEHDDKPPEELADRAANINDLISDLETEIDELAEQLSTELDVDAAVIRGQIAVALRKAADRARGEAQLAAAIYGTQPGELRRLPVNERLDLARRLNNARIRDIAERFGAQSHVRLNARLHHNPLMADEIVGVTAGRDITRILPSEFGRLRDPARRTEFYRDFAEGKLAQFDYTGVERTTKGGIILLEDGSLSMGGPKERCAKAVMLNFMDIARQEKREFHLIHFGSETQLYHIDFSTPDMYTTDRIFAAVELFCNGGTAFQEPLTAGVERLQIEHRATGRVSGDIVMITDGLCAVRDQWLAWFHEEQRKLGFTTWGVIIGAPRTSEPLWTICDGRVYTLRDLHSSRELSDIWQGV